MKNCGGVVWVDDNVYVSGYDEHGSCGQVIILINNHTSYTIKLSVYSVTKCERFWSFRLDKYFLAFRVF
jgi:hypothetical protein